MREGSEGRGGRGWGKVVKVMYGWGNVGEVV